MALEPDDVPQHEPAETQFPHGALIDVDKSQLLTIIGELFDLEVVSGNAAHGPQLSLVR
jgi:hypothetical protein